MLVSIIIWYFILQGLALAGLPLAFVGLRHLPSRGYAAAKALGLLLTGVLFWWGGLLHLWPNSTAAAVTAAALVFAFGVWRLRRHWAAIAPWWRVHRGMVIVTEGLFLCAFVLWAVVRATQPQLETAGGEKWMEIAFLNAVLRAPTMPPHDPWLSGYAISYYYLGYVLLGMVTRLSGLPATVAFNLGNAAWYALAAVGAYGIVYDLLIHSGIQRRVAGVPLLGPLMLLLTGNAEGFMEMLHSLGRLPASFWQWLDIRNLEQAPQAPFAVMPQRFFWWWQASRTLRDYTPWGDHQEIIDEFPMFSFLLGDMHPHVLALPFVLLIIALALNLYRRGTCVQSGWSWEALKVRFVPLLGYALVLGTLGFLNTWDLPIYWALMFGALALGKATQSRGFGNPLGASAETTAQMLWQNLFDRVWQLLPEGVFLGVVSIAAYFPFWYALRSQAGGILPNLFNATRWPHFALMFAPLLWPLIGTLVVAVRRAKIPVTAIALWAIALMLTIAVLALLVGSVAAYPYLMLILRREAMQGIAIPPEMATAAIVQRLLHPWVGLGLALGVSACVWVLLHTFSAQPADEKHSVLPIDIDAFPILMALLGLLLTLAPEFVYLQDIFMTRMNTIFKFYFQAWVLWSLVGAWQLARWLKAVTVPAAWRYSAVGLALLVIAIGLVYPALAIPARAKEHGTPWTLDGAAWLDVMHPHDADAIRWLNANVTGAPVIIEAPGDNRRAYVYEGRVSALTGLPTVLGWAGHQMQWRGNYDEPTRREQDLELLFTTADHDVAHSLLAQYKVRYVFIGAVELNRYTAGVAKFAALLPIAYQNDGVIIYQVEP